MPFIPDVLYDGEHNSFHVFIYEPITYSPFLTLSIVFSIFTDLRVLEFSIVKHLNMFMGENKHVVGKVL